MAIVEQSGLKNYRYNKNKSARVLHKKYDPLYWRCFLNARRSRYIYWLLPWLQWCRPQSRRSCLRSPRVAPAIWSLSHDKVPSNNLPLYVSVYTFAGETQLYSLKCSFDFWWEHETFVFFRILKFVIICEAWYWIPVV
jgi:hypothetical protein